MSDPEKNKATAQAFYDLMFNQCRPAEAIDEYPGDTYIQHRLPFRRRRSESCSSSSRSGC
ncbi:hypothetical protein ACFW93_47635 [Streptomyces canus]|uniref:hypothetical protein n=1 Tax=Streptomyces canus TaxID=58343 RepID=UPI0036BB75C5